VHQWGVQLFSNIRWRGSKIDPSQRSSFFFIWISSCFVTRPLGESENEGYYGKSHGLQALAIETAEACDKWLHRRVRED